VPPLQPRHEQGMPHLAELLCHPDSACPPVSELQARATFLDPEVLSLGFTLTAKLDDLKLPEPAAPTRADHLWEHTCFEAFLAESEGEAYFELNVAPSGAWATYRFQRYRVGGVPALELEPSIVLHRRPARLEAHILLRLPQRLAAQRLRLGFSAVIEQQDGSLSYWALQHPEGPPDFHHPVTFALALDPGETP
jgi:hypothetical protein